MMGLMQLVGIAVCGMLVCVLLKGMQSNLYPVCALLTCLIVLGYALQLASYVMDFVVRLAQRYSVSDFYLQTVFKVIGIGYVCSLASGICRDAGQTSIGAQVELFGKLLILVQALPVASRLLDTITGML